MNRYELTNAKNLIHGYFLPSPPESGRPEAEFERAKQECVSCLEKQLANVKAVTKIQFFSKVQ